MGDTDDGKVLHLSGDLDEDLSTFGVDFEIDIKKFFIKIPIKGEAKVSWSPGFQKGSLQTTFGPIQGGPGPDENDLGIKITGTVQIKDQNEERVNCLEMDGDLYNN